MSVYDNEVAQAIVEAASILSSRLDHYGHEYLASAEVGDALRAVPRLADSFESIASSLHRIADHVAGNEEDMGRLEVLCDSVESVAQAIEKLKP